MDEMYIPSIDMVFQLILGALKSTEIIRFLCKPSNLLSEMSKFSRESTSSCEDNNMQTLIAKSLQPLILTLAHTSSLFEGLGTGNNNIMHLEMASITPLYPSSHSSFHS